MEDYILWMVLIVVVVAAAILTPQIVRWYRHTFMTYNEETGYWEKKKKPAKKSKSAQKVTPKKAAENKTATQKTAPRTSNANNSQKKPQSAPKMANNLNQPATRQPRINETPQEKRRRRRNETQNRLSELYKSNPGHRFDLECISATVESMARRAKVIERRNGKSYEVVRDFVVTFESIYNTTHICLVGEDLFNDLAVGKSGMLTFADGMYINFEPLLDITDIIGDQADTF